MTFGWAGEAGLAQADAALPTQPFQLAQVYGDKVNASGVCSFGARRSISGHEPRSAGRYPLFVYLTGTQMSYQGIEAQALTRAMAERGFVAASVEYDNGAYAYCNGMLSKAHCLFAASPSESALSKLCARANTDCDLGIVVAGFSQGANLASLAANHDARVKGAYLLGHGHKAGNHMEVKPCMEASATKIDSRDVRSINGEHDGFFGVEVNKVRKQLELVSGLSCAEHTSCGEPQGGGWYIVRDGQLTDHSADHCYFLHEADGYCRNFKGLDATWERGNEPWSMAYNLDWLASKVMRPHQAVAQKSAPLANEQPTPAAEKRLNASQKAARRKDTK